jgi:hypothetical protein
MARPGDRVEAVFSSDEEEEEEEEEDDDDAMDVREEGAGGGAKVDEDDDSDDDDGEEEEEGTAVAMDEGEAGEDDEATAKQWGEMLAVAEGALGTLKEAGGKSQYKAYSQALATLRGAAHAIHRLTGRSKPAKDALVRVLGHLNETREAMAERFLLPPDLWLEWVRDEATLAVEGGKAQAVIERAVADCPSNVTLWLAYLGLLEVRLCYAL